MSKTVDERNRLLLGVVPPPPLPPTVRIRELPASFSPTRLSGMRANYPHPYDPSGLLSSGSAPTAPPQDFGSYLGLAAALKAVCGELVPFSAHPTGLMYLLCSAQGQHKPNSPPRFVKNRVMSISAIHACKEAAKLYWCVFHLPFAYKTLIL